MSTVEVAVPAKAERWTAQWRELFDEVVTSGLCTGCAACVIACPHDVIGYDHHEGGYRPFHLEDELGPEDCVHGVKGCTSCTRACPRFRAWEPEAEQLLFGRTRAAEDVSGLYSDIVLARASDRGVQERGQDGGLVSALLMWALDNGYMDAALVSYLEGDGSSWRAVPGVARTHEDILGSAGSRYTYSANTLAYDEAVAGGAQRIALVGMGCQTSAPPVMQARKIGKVGRHFAFSIGLLCSKTFDDRIFEELFEAKYGIRRADIRKVNIKGVFQIWTTDGGYHEVPLKECHGWTREGCALCPDFAAEHADISTGGIGSYNDWTLTIVRTEIGRELLDGCIRDGVIDVRPSDDDPGAVALMHKLAAKSRKRWPATAVNEPRRLPNPSPKASGESVQAPSATDVATAATQARTPRKGLSDGERTRSAATPPAKAKGLLEDLSAPAYALLGSDAVAHVWTQNPDGSAQVSVVWFLVQGDEIVFGTDAASRKARNLARNPSIVMSVEDDERNERGYQRHIVIRGRAVLEPGPEPALMDQLAAKYTDLGRHPLALRDSPSAVVVRVAIDRISGEGPWFTTDAASRNP